MKLIADSGSTKTEWSLVDELQVLKTFKTSGINPFYQSEKEIIAALSQEFLSQIKEKVESVYFYGAGCANEEKNSIVIHALSDVIKAPNIFVGSDLLGAARSLCQTSEGVACILGTGSNSCYYDGKTIVSNVSPLGFILGDEGSGAVIGKKLVADILKRQIPPTIIQKFFEAHQLTPAEILDSVYKKPFPNRFLAQFTKFIFKYIHVAEIEEIVICSFKEFITRNVHQYMRAETLEIHFTGSIAFFFKPQLEKVLEQYNLKLGKITMSPLADLVSYHMKIS